MPSDDDNREYLGEVIDYVEATAKVSEGATGVTLTAMYWASYVEICRLARIGAAVEQYGTDNWVKLEPETGRLLGIASIVLTPRHVPTPFPDLNEES